MDDEDLLSVGQFARLAGLSTHALRHYDSVQLLPPAEVDPHSGYRRYSHAQLVTARLISDLRWLSIPIQQVRTIIADPDSATARGLLAAQAARLTRDRHHLNQQISQLTDYAREGPPVPMIATTTVPVQIKIGVTDKARARQFYNAAFDLTESVIRHTDDADFTGYQFGTYGQLGFFLLVLSDTSSYDHPTRSTFGLTVTDLDDTHQRALKAGGVEAVPVSTPPGMPRNSAITDPDGNWIWLYQG